MMHAVVEEKKKEENQKTGGDGGKGGGGKEEDWKCTSCGFPNFGRNVKCHKCGAQKQGDVNTFAATGDKKAKTSKVKVLEVPSNFDYKVSHKFIDEMYGLLKVGAGGEKEIQKISKRLRKMELGFEHQELKKMRAMHCESALREARNMEALRERMGEVEICQGATTNARFRTGQSVHHFWAGWFKTAEEPKIQLQ